MLTIVNNKNGADLTWGRFDWGRFDLGPIWSASSGVMVSVLASSAVDREFGSRSG
jgi:hypothetical protein